MTPNELTEIRERQPNQKCICKKCVDCFHYRPWPAKDAGGNPIGIKTACSIEVLAVTLRSLIGSVDGLQGGVNQATNRAMEVKSIIERAAINSINRRQLGERS